jgi:hypothetical protein
MVEILSRDDGHYQYRVFTFVDADEELRDPAYWSPTEDSGLYETAEQAEQDASIGVHWLRQLKSN